MDSKGAVNGFAMDSDMILNRFPRDCAGGLVVSCASLYVCLRFHCFVHGAGLDFMGLSMGLASFPRCLSMLLECYFFGCSRCLSVGAPSFCLILHCVGSCCGLFSSLLSMMVAPFSLCCLLWQLVFVVCLCSLCLLLLGWLVIVCVLLVHVRRASVPPYFFIPCTIWDVV